MFEIRVEEKFSAAHQLKGYEGKCEELHGHNYRVEVAISGKDLTEAGLLLDFKEVKRVLREIIDEYFDHKMLNEVELFKDRNPSAENIAQVIFYLVKEKLPKNVRLEWVRVWETDTSSALFKEG